MQYPASTGQVARHLGVTEPQLSETVRRGRVSPPPVVAGRRLWGQHHVAQAATALGLDPDIAPVSPSRACASGARRAS